jgi:hypothetical protein
MWDKGMPAWRFGIDYVTGTIHIGWGWLAVMAVTYTALLVYGLS